MPYYNRTIVHDPAQLSLLHRIPDGTCGACAQPIPLSDLTPVRFPARSEQEVRVCPTCIAMVVPCSGDNCFVRGFPWSRGFTTTADRRVLCGDCLTHNGRCAACEEPGRVVTRVAGTNDRLCLSCSVFMTNRCTLCELAFYADDVQTDAYGHKFCSGCATGPAFRKTVGRCPAPQVYSYHTNVLDLTRCNVPSGIAFGFEIEITTGRRGPGSAIPREQAVRQFYAIARDRAIAKSDSSVTRNGDEGFEIVTIPLSLDGSRLLIDDMFGHAQFARMAIPADTCGMHVHISRSALTRPQIAKMLIFTSDRRNYGLLKWLARRDLELNTYTRVVPRNWKTICAFDRLRSQNSHAARHAFVTDQARYVPLNLLNAATVEIRMFASTNVASIAKGNLETCAALVAFTAAGVASTADCATPERFLDFVRANAQRFPNLAARIVDENAHELIAAAARRAVRTRETANVI
jgi:hypothetical protein